MIYCNICDYDNSLGFLFCAVFASNSMYVQISDKKSKELINYRLNDN